MCTAESGMDFWRWVVNNITLTGIAELENRLEEISRGISVLSLDFQQFFNLVFLT